MIETNITNPEIIVGKIRNVVITGNGTARTDTVFYDIIARIPGGTAVQVFERQVPQVRLWPADMELDVDRMVGISVIGFKYGRDIRWHFYECPLVAGCITPPTGPGVAPGIIPGTIGTPIEGDGGTAPAPSPTDTPGGEF